MITSYFKAKSKPKGSNDETGAPSAGVKRAAEDTDNDDTATTSTSSSASAPEKRYKQSPTTSNPTTRSSAVDTLLSHITEDSWRNELEQHFSNSTPFSRLADFVARERRQHTVYPPAHQTFTALNLCALHQVKVVIVGQDPYHGPNQAHGLAFSVGRQEKIPPSLRNIYKELLSDKQIRSMPNHGHLERWAKQGVLLLNTSLTVRAGQANSHAKAGWHAVTDRIIQCVAAQGRPLVFLLWGKPAHETTTKALSSTLLSQHIVMNTSHPSPLGATKTKAPFMGSKCFRKCNDALVTMGYAPIDWNVDGALPP